MQIIQVITQGLFLQSSFQEKINLFRKPSGNLLFLREQAKSTLHISTQGHSHVPHHSNHPLYYHPYWGAQSWIEEVLMKIIGPFSFFIFYSPQWHCRITEVKVLSP